MQIHVENQSGRRYSYDSKNDVSTFTENGEIIFDEKELDSEIGDWYEYNIPLPKKLVGWKSWRERRKYMASENTVYM